MSPLRRIVLTAPLVGLFAGSANGQEPGASSPYRPGPIPDRIVLTWSGDPARSQAATWRTDGSVHEAVAQIVPARPSPDLAEHAREVRGSTTPVDAENGLAHHHSVAFTELEPDALYAYRVRGNDAWSEWFHFRTASEEPAPFSLIYLGDTQNDIKSLAARTVRAAYSAAPNARFILHAGDLVNLRSGQSWDDEWGEWFEAGGWVYGSVPSIPAIGNHEYPRDDPSAPPGEDNPSYRTAAWHAHFTLPRHGPAGLEETVYYVDYQGVRILALNPVESDRLEDQARWIERVLQDNPNHWTIAVFHYPMYSVAAGRDNPLLREHWEPLLDRYGVDLVLQGHDHTYGRHRGPSGTELSTAGTDAQRSVDAGPVYVVSVAGPKMYEIDPAAEWMERLAEDTQLYQIIRVEEDRLGFEARTVTDELYDAFDLVKRADGTNRLIDRMPEATTGRRVAPVSDR